MGYLLLQLGLAVAMFVVTAISGLTSIKVLKRVKQGADGATSLTLSLLSCFAGGVFFATCFLDILPHVNANFAQFKKDSSFATSYAIPELFVSLGFFAVYALEEICSRIFADNHHHAHNHSEDIVLTTIYGNASTGSYGNNVNIRHPHEKKETIFHSIALTVAMSFHSILEGLALGIQTSRSEILTLFISLILHKGIEAFSVGLQVSRGNMNRIKMVIITILVYSLMTPVGSLTGVSISHSNIDKLVKGGALVILEGLAVGTFVYVTFLEVISAERANQYSNLYQLLATFGGFAVVAIFLLAEELITVH